MKISRMVAFTVIALLPFLLLPFLAKQAGGQVLYGTIVGSVTDPTGASVPDATVKITQTGTNQSREVKTNDSGGYTISTVPVGTYEVSISKEGFRSHSAKEIVVRLNTVVRVDATLQVGDVSESVAVTAQAAALQTDRADVHAEVTTTSLINLPQPTRTYQGVFQLLPGVAPPMASSGGTNNPSRSMQFSANGTSRSGTNIRVDGVSATNPWVQFFSLLVPSIEAIETVNVVTNSPDAEQGMANGAAVNVSLKSGTNDFHGAVYEYNQISGLAARNFFLPASQGIAKLVDNDFGGALGGRIIRDKLFFFGSYELDLLRQGMANTTTVPTDAIKNGDMSGSPNPIYDPATGTATGTGKLPFAGNIIPPVRMSPIVKKLTALVPSPNVLGLANNYYINTPMLYNLHRIDTKFDWNSTDKLRLSFRVADQPYKNLRDTVFGPVLGGANNHIQDGYTFATSTSATYVTSSNLVIDGTFALMKNIQNLFPPLADQKYGLNVLGIPGVNVGDLPLAGGMPQFNVSGYGGYGYAYPPLVYDQTVLEYTGNATWVKGPHNIRFGVDLNHQSMDQQEIGPTSFGFTGGVTALNGGASPNQFNSYADFLLGLPQNKAINILPEGERTLRTWQHSLYIRDQWQVSRKFTVTLGLRWEYYPVPTRRNRQIENYDIASNKVLICGVGPNPDNCGIQVSKRIFAPRIGVAFRPTGTFVIRAGYAMSPEQINMYRDAIGSYPVSMAYSDTGANSYLAVSPLEQGFPAVPLPNISSGAVSLPPGVTTVFLPKNFVRGYTQSWNFTLQKQLGHGWVAQAGYVGTNTIHQHTRYNINYGLPGGGAASQPFFPLGITGAMTMIMPNETMSYNSLQTTLERRFSNGVQFMASYTRSKWLGTCCDDSGDGQPAIPIPQYWKLNRALMGQDRPDNLRLSGIYELPFGKGKKMLSNSGVASYLAGGWQLNAVLSAYSGAPFSVSASGASLNAPGSTQRADQVKQHVQKLGGIGDAPFFDPLAFAPVTTARFGTAGFNSMRGPGVVNLDMGVFRSFKLTERIAVQFRGEALNATNTPHFSQPGGNVSNMLLNSDGTVRSLGGYAQVKSTSAPSRLIDERYFRFGLRLSF